MKQRGGQSMASCTDRSDSREEGSRKKTTARDTTTACVSGKIHYVIPVPLLFVARCTYQAMRQRHPQPIGGANSGWRRNARALRDDGKTKQNELAVRTLERRLALLDALSSLHHCNFYVHTTTSGGDVLRFTAEDGGGAHSHGEAWKTTIP